MRHKIFAIAVLFAMPVSLFARSHAEAGKSLNPQDAALISKAVENEKTTLAEIRKTTPFVETYLQRETRRKMMLVILSLITISSAVPRSKRHLTQKSSLSATSRRPA